MIILMGIGLVGSHFMFLMAVAKICSAIFPSGGLTIFLILAVMSGFGMMRIQTWLETYFISQHIKRRPNSGWRVVVPKPKQKVARAPRWRQALGALKFDKLTSIGGAIAHRLNL